MRVTVSVPGRFHAFYLARELDRQGCLDRLVTTYPRRVVARWSVPGKRVSSLWPIEVARRLLPESLRERCETRGTVQRGYDVLAANRLSRAPDVVVAWSGSAERTLRRAKELGAVAIVERGSTHMRTQREILREEYERQGVNPKLPTEKLVEREEREYALADRIAIPSSFVERSFLERGVAPEKLLRLPYGVDPAEFAPVAKEDSVFRVVFAGALGVRKGTKYLLEAFAELDCPNSELLLLGFIRKEARPWLAQAGGCIRCPGHVPQRDLHQWYSQGSVFVLPSVEEGLAMVLLQAMACGLPVICSPHTGGEDLIREGEEGFIVPVGDVKALRQRLSWCHVHQDELREMGQAARRRVLEKFTWRDYGRRVIDAYRVLV